MVMGLKLGHVPPRNALNGQAGVHGQVAQQHESESVSLKEPTLPRLNARVKQRKQNFVLIAKGTGPNGEIGVNVRQKLRAGTASKDGIVRVCRQIFSNATVQPLK